MSFKIVVTLVAREDTVNAFSYYEDIRLGLGEEFLEELDKRYKAIEGNPFLFSSIDSRGILRDVLLDRFPYVVIYKIEEEHVIVISIHNSHKKPISI